MWRSLAILAAIAGGVAADRMEAGPDTPPFADVTSLRVEQLPPPSGGACQPLTWTLDVDLVAGTWRRIDRRCTSGKTTSAAVRGGLDKAARAALAAKYKQLDERVPKMCEGGREPIIYATISGANSLRVPLVDRGCERTPRLRELAALLVALKPDV